jgi:hypothetical protein
MSDDVWMYGFGFGPTLRAGSATIDVDLMGWHVNKGAAHTNELSLLGQLRLSLGVPIGPLALVAGGAINAYISRDDTAPLLAARRVPGTTMPSDDVRGVLWPSLFVGVRL